MKPNEENNPTIYVDFVTITEEQLRPDLEAPEGLVANEIGPDSLVLNWDPATGEDNIFSYAVYRGDENADDLSDFEVIGRTSETTFSSTDLSGNTIYRYRVVAISDENLHSLPSDWVEAETVTSSEPVDNRPAEFILYDNYPNPFNPTTNIRYQLLHDASVSLRVYSINGRLIKTLVEQAQQNRGEYSVQFDASGLASGVYLYKIDFNSGSRIISQTRRMLLVK